MDETNITQLINDLKNGNDEERRYAAEDLGDSGNEEAIYPLVEALNDKSVAVQEAAVDALISIGGEKVCQAVTPLLDSDNAKIRNLAREVFEGLGEVAVSCCLRLYESNSHDLRKIAVDTLGKIENPKENKVFDTIIKALDDSHINVVQAACEALGKIGREEAIEHLVKHIGIHPWVDSTIFLSLGKIGSYEAKQALKSVDSGKLSPEAEYALKVALEMV